MTPTSTETRDRIGEASEPRVFTDEEKATLRSWQGRLQALAQTISGEKGVVVKQGKGGDKLWYIDTSTREIFFDPEEVLERAGTEEEGVLLGSIAHEAGHALITDFSFFPEEAAKELGLVSLLRAVEERPTDQVVRDRFAGAGLWVDQMRRTLAREGELEGSALDLLGYVPHFAQLDGIIVHDPHYIEEQRNAKSSIALEHYEAIRTTVERIEREIPNTKDDDEKKIALAKERYKATYKEIFPHVKELAEQDMKTERLRQVSLFLIEQSRTIDRTPVEDRTGEERDRLTELPLELFYELLHKLYPVIRKKAEGHAQKTNEELSLIDDKPNTSSVMLDQIDTFADIVGGYNKLPVPADTFSEELEEKLLEIFDELEKEQREKIEKLIKKALEKIEDIITKLFEGAMEDSPLPTHAAVADKDAKQASAKAEAKQRAQDEADAEALRELIEEEQAALDQKSVYDENYEQVREFEDQLHRELYQVFYPQRKKKTTLKSSGTKPNIRALFNFIAARAAGAKDLPAKFWESKDIPKVNDFAFTILVDLSGSMAGYDDDPGTIGETFKGVIILAEVLSRLGIKCEILGFQDEIIPFKNFDEELTDEIRNRMAGMLKEVNSENPGGHNQSGYNDDGPCLLEASKRLKKQVAKHKFLTVLSDGQPAGRHSTAEDLDDAVETITTETNQKLAGLGLGSGTEHVEDYYPVAFPNLSVKDLAEQLGKIVQGMIISPESFQAMLEANKPELERKRSERKERDEDDDPWYDESDW